MCARESSFFAGNADGRRGWATAVTLTKVAQLENRGGHFAADEEEWRPRIVARERPGRGREHSRAFGYLYIFCFQPTRVAACLAAVPGSTFLWHSRLSLHPAPPRVASPRILFSFSSYVSSRWPANKRVILSSPALVIHPQLEFEISPFPRRLNYGWLPRRKIKKLGPGMRLPFATYLNLRITRRGCYLSLCALIHVNLERWN